MLFVTILGIYILIGLIFAVYFLFSGYHKILPDAAGTGMGVRFIWAPATLAIWPILVVKLLNREPGQ